VNQLKYNIPYLTPPPQSAPLVVASQTLTEMITSEQPYPSSYQLNADKRTVLLTFLNDILVSASRETLFIACQVLDKYSELCRIIQWKQMYLAATGSALIAMKFNDELIDPVPLDFCKMCPFQITVLQLIVLFVMQKMERKILKVLEWKIYEISPHALLDELFLCLRHSAKSWGKTAFTATKIDDVQRLMHEIVEPCIQEQIHNLNAEATLFPSDILHYALVEAEKQARNMSFGGPNYGRDGGFSVPVGGLSLHSIIKSFKSMIR
jgi:hypothetical protein